MPLCHVLGPNPNDELARAGVTVSTPRDLLSLLRNSQSLLSPSNDTPVTMEIKHINTGRDSSRLASATPSSSHNATHNDSVFPYGNWDGASNLTYFNDSTSLLGNVTSTEEPDEGSWLLNELQLIKAIVLIVVVSILLISTCKLVLKTFSRYAGPGPKHDQV